MTSKDIEIMSPVGSYEMLMAAIQGGANSVYFGIENLNMRSKSSKNFTIEDLKKIVGICDKHHVRTYITLNTVIFDKELDLMRKIVDASKRYGVTAVIASDASVIQYAYSQGVEVHISTQSNVTNIEAVKFYAHFADVMVTARELNLNQVKAITDTIAKEQIKGPSGELVQIEIFAHGALCMAVSGKCYMSLDTMNSSANRGACLQPCRRPYEVTDKDGGLKFEVDNEYIMSPEDLKTIDFIDKMLRAGVRVLKIEGRGRSPEYVKIVTATYREAVDAWFDDDFTEKNIARWNKQLASVYNRGFWDGYYLGRKMGEWTKKYGSQATQRKVYVGKVTNFFKKLNVAEIKMETHDLKLDDDVYIIGDTTGVYEYKVEEMRLDLKAVAQVVKGDVFSIKTKDILRRNDKVYKITYVEDEEDLMA
ncbi:MAG: U32 family peptidase [Bacteroidetes bacterium]|nr:MAG: U32 family peptidase [Bacteroidota bacterium]